MIEPREEDIQRNFRSLSALYEQNGRRINEFIRSVSESLAYQQALVLYYRQAERERILGIRDNKDFQTQGDDDELA